MVTSTRIYNFSAGPAVLPEPVLLEAQRNLLELPGVGMSILEVSHRSKVFDEVINTAESDMRKLAGIPDNYRVLFLQGGASLQFSMVPMNLLSSDTTADYIVTGSWSKKAVKEAKRVGGVNIAATSEPDNFGRIPKQSELNLTSSAAYVHMTSNNTIAGTEWKEPPDVGDVPLVSDASSNIFNGPMDITKYGLIYAGSQKNLAPSGTTLVIIRDDLVEKGPSTLPSMLSYKTHAEAKSLYNTPSVFPIYVIGLVLKWLLANGGLSEMAAINQRKAAKLYAEIDRTGFYRSTTEKDSRSLMNVTFRLSSEDLEKQFIKEAESVGLDGLKGHRSVGGMRASIYNAFPERGVDALVEFMKEFERKQG